MRLRAAFPIAAANELDVQGLQTDRNRNAPALQQT